MNRRLLYPFLTFALFVGSLPLCAGKEKAKVKFAYDVDFETYFDNRELYRSNFSTSMSIFGARLTPYVGFEVKQKNMSHSVMAGIDVQKDFGASPISGKYAAGATDEQKKTQSNLALFGEITMYYRLRAQARDNDIEMYAGIFPRRFCGEEYGRAFISDSLRFYDNNLEGVLLKVTRPKAAFEIGADWCGKIGVARREKFLIFAAGHGYVLPWLNMGYAVSGEHLASSEEVWFLRRKEPTLGADITVTKRIPVAAGLGGSSADAAAVVRAAALYMPEIFGGEDTAAESVAIGSDVPVLVSGGCALMRGIGDEIIPIAAPMLNLCLAWGEGGVNSGEAYKLFDGLYPDKKYAPADTDALVRALGAGDIKEIARHTHNALALPAQILCASVRSALDALKTVGALNASVTGSGNCCFGIFENKEDADAAAEKIAALGLFAASVKTLTDKI